jgi:hypothetical protein
MSPPFIGGKVSGGGSVSGFATSMGEQVMQTFIYAASTSRGDSNFDFKSEGSGNVNTLYGGAKGNGGSAVSGTSSQSLGSSALPLGPAFFATGTSGGSSVASAAGAFDGAFAPSGSSDETGGSGSGAGSFTVASAGRGSNPTPTYYFVGMLSGSGTAQTVAGGSATAFNDVTSAGGRGSGSAAGNTAGTIVAISAGQAASSDTSSTGDFTGNGSGSYGTGSNRPDEGGTVNGKGSGSGTALVAGIVDENAFDGLNINNNADFNSNGVGSGFVDSANGGAVGSASADVSGTATGQVLTLGARGGNDVIDLSFGGSAMSNGDGTFVGGFSPTQSSGQTGGSGSGKGSINVAGVAASPDGNDDAKVTTVIGSATAETVAGGSATGFNDLGAAGGLGSGATQGSANGAITGNLDGGVVSGAGTATGIFSTDGSGSFGSTGSLALP